MHATTKAVRDQYELFPYPAGVPVLRQGTDARLLLSHVEATRPEGRPLRVLDAGCGSGVGIVGCAVSQPDVEFHGIDLCEASLKATRAQLKQRGISNVRLQRVDLMTLEGLEVPDGGYDVILSSGVVHHLVDPAEGLRRLEGVLAPHGVLSLMVYGTRGRQALYRMVRAVDALVSRDCELKERLEVARQLVAEVQSEGLESGPWHDHRTIADAEFVDRYLHCNETSYDVPEFLDLIESAGLQHLRWVEPRDWTPESVLPEGHTLRRARELEPREQWRLVDELFFRPSFEALLCKPENEARCAPGVGFGQEPLAISPEATLTFSRRNLRGDQRTERLEVQVRQGEPVRLPQGPCGQALTLLADQVSAFAVVDLVKSLGDQGVATKDAMAAISELLRLEVLYRPHLADV